MSTVMARIESAPRIAPLLVDQLTAPVRFTQAASELVREGARTFVEVGPGNVLSGLVKRIDKGVKAIPVNSLLRSSASRRRSALPETNGFARLDGKVALVTGASRGIGRAIAIELAGAGAQVVVGYRSGRDEAEEVATEIGGRAVQADVGAPDEAGASRR